MVGCDVAVCSIDDTKDRSDNVNELPIDAAERIEIGALRSVT